MRLSFVSVHKKSEFFFHVELPLLFASHHSIRLTLTLTLTPDPDPDPDPKPNPDPDSNPNPNPNPNGEKGPYSCCEVCFSSVLAILFLQDFVCAKPHFSEAPFW